MNRDLLQSCLAMAVGLLLKDNEGIVVVHPDTKIPYLVSRETGKIKLSLCDTDNIFDNANMNNKITPDNLHGHLVWLHDQKPN